MADLYGANGKPVVAKDPPTTKHMVGGVELVAYDDPECRNAVVNFGPGPDQGETFVHTVKVTNVHNLYLHALVREVSELRARLEALESKTVAVNPFGN